MGSAGWGGLQWRWRVLQSAFYSPSPSPSFAGMRCSTLHQPKQDPTKVPQRLPKSRGQRARSRFSHTIRGNAISLTSIAKVPHRKIEYSSLFPCSVQYDAPRIEHLVFLEDGTIVELISDALALPRTYVEELIQFGAVYYALVCPPPPEGSLTAEQMELYKQALSISQNTKRASLKGKTIREAQRALRVTNIYEGIEAGTYVRVHVHPKRFPRCYEVDWKSRVIAETDSFLVVDKPAAVPVGGSVDNLEECCATFLSRSLGLSSPLILTHQLDNCTEGCIVLAKTKEFASRFHQLLREKKVQKHYVALAASSVPAGKCSHFMRPGSRHPRIISTEPYSGWAMCELEILGCQEILWPEAAILSKYKVEDPGLQPRNSAYEYRLQLLTGRTHQVRAQFAALGAPLIGDSMYAPAVVSRLQNPEIDPFFRGKIETEINELALEAWISQHGPEPECAVGLQASQISWDDGAFTFEVEKPWWRT